MLKKVICLLLVLALSAALFSCVAGGVADNGSENGDSAERDDNNLDNQQEPEDKEESKDSDKELIDDKGNVDIANEITFFSNVNKSNPNVIVTKTSSNHSKLGACEGYFVTTIYADDDYTFYFDYSKFNKIGEGPIIEKIPADTVICKNGEYVLESTGASVWAVPDVLAMGLMLNIDKDYLGNYTINETADKLTTTVNSQQAYNIFGVEIDASAITLIITTDGTHLSGITLEYKIGEVTTQINTSYTYENLTRDAQQ